MNDNNYKKYIVLLTFLFIGLCQVMAQNEKKEELSSKLVNNLGLETLQYVSEVQLNTLIDTENSVYIQQIGSYNTAATNIYANNKEINLIQNGNANRASISLTGEKVTHNILQNGDNNLFLEYGNNSNLTLERNIIQDGNDHGVFIFGSNSMSDKLILKQQGASKTITIRNFN